MNPTSAGVMNNMVIGGTTPLAGTFTTLRFNSTLSLNGSTGTANYLLQSNGASAPSWVNPATLTVSAASTATTATNATNIGITDDTTTNASVYPTWVTTTTGNLPAKTASTKLSFNPSTGALTSTSLTPTNALAIAYGGTNSTATATAGGVGYGTGTAHAYSAAGTSGQYLQSNGSSAPTWVTPAGSAIIQLVQATYSTQTSNSTTTYADSGLTGTITPTSASSKVLITITGAMYKSNGNVSNSLSLKIQKNGSNLLTFADLSLYTATATENAGFFVINYLDSPATTSATTYKLQFANSFVNSASVVVQFNNNPSTITLTEVA
jgi:hypothetical protein